jgi:hypothetical protein
MKALLVALLLSMAATAQPVAKNPTPAPVASTQAPSSGQIVSTTALTDPVFRVRAKVVGLDRTVEMLQWRKADLPAPPHYEMAWTAERIDSKDFDAAHRNTIEFPFNGQRWWTSDAALDGHPLSADVLARLDAWTPFKPDLTQLPANIAVSFQPDGDWLSTSQDPAHPQIGDLRVRWREIASAPAPAGAVLVAGRWEMPSSTAASTAAASSPESSTDSTPEPRAARPTLTASGPDTPSEWSQRLPGTLIEVVIVAGIAIVLLTLAWLWGRRSANKPAPRKRRSRKK